MQSIKAQSRMTGFVPGLNFLPEAAIKLPTKNFSLGQAGFAAFVAAKSTSVGVKILFPFKMAAAPAASGSTVW